MVATFAILPRYAAQIRWNLRGSCGQSGCRAPSCVCSFCLNPIGYSESQLQELGHDPECDGCPQCDDQLPIIMWRGEGKATEQAQFHTKCFEKITHLREGIPS